MKTDEAFTGAFLFFRKGVRRHGWVRAGCRGQVSMEGFAGHGGESAQLRATDARFSTLHHHQRQPITPRSRPAPAGTDLRDTPGGGTTRGPPSDLGRGGWGYESPFPSRARAGGAGRTRPALRAPRRGLGAGRYPEPGRGGDPAAAPPPLTFCQRPASGRRPSSPEGNPA